MSEGVMAQPRFTRLPAQLDAQITTLEGMTNRRKEKDASRLDQVRLGMEAAALAAAKLKSEYEELQRQFGPLLDRLVALDVEQIRTFAGQDRVIGVPGKAKEIRVEISQAIRWLDGVGTQIQGLTVSDVEQNRPRAIAEKIQDLGARPTLIIDRIEGFMKSIEGFRQAQPT